MYRTILEKKKLSILFVFFIADRYHISYSLALVCFSAFVQSGSYLQRVKNRDVVIHDFKKEILIKKVDLIKLKTDFHINLSFRTIAICLRDEISYISKDRGYTGHLYKCYKYFFKNVSKNYVNEDNRAVRAFCTEIQKGNPLCPPSVFEFLELREKTRKYNKYKK